MVVCVYVCARVCVYVCVCVCVCVCVYEDARRIQNQDQDRVYQKNMYIICNFFREKKASRLFELHYI